MHTDFIRKFQNMTKEDHLVVLVVAFHQSIRFQSLKFMISPGIQEKIRSKCSQISQI